MNALFWQNERKQCLFWGLLSLLLIVASSRFAAPVEGFQSMVLSSVVPVLNGTQTLSDKAQEGVLWTGRFLEMHKRIGLLEEENERLRMGARRAQQIYFENVSLRELLKTVSPLQGVPLTVELMHDPSGPFVKSGLAYIGGNKLSRGQAAMAKDGLFGRVVSIEGSYARILFLNDPSFRLPVRFVQSGFEGLIGGNGTERLKILSLERDTLTPLEGDVVVTSGKGGVFPAGLPVGRVLTYGVANASGFFVAPFARLNDTRFLTILRQPVKGIVKDVVEDDADERD